MSDLLSKVSKNRTRPAKIEGENVLVKVYSQKEMDQISSDLSKLTEKKMATFLSGQFLYENGEEIFTPEFFTSDACPNVFALELAEMFRDVNSGTYKKK